MHRSPAQFLFALVAVVAAAAEPAARTHEPSVSHYEIDLREARSGWLRVSLETTCVSETCELQMPVWSATYQVRDFAQYIARLEAEEPGGRSLFVRKLAPSRWSVPGQQGRRIRVRYRILADRPGPFGAYADEGQVTLNLAQTLVYPADGRDQTFTLAFSNRPETFKEALALPAVEGRYRAPNYDRLIDTPVHLSAFEEAGFERGGKTIRVVAFGPAGGYDLNVLLGAAKSIVVAGERLMGELPFEAYTFVYIFSEDDGGGMEYRDGTVIYGPANCRTCGLPGLTAHEFFHLWNVKRIRPASMEPIDYTAPNPSPSLWFAEGVTSTYAQYLQLESGLMSGPEMLGHLERLINEHESRGASRSQSAEESSIDAWLERYPAYGRADRSVSYYTKGEIIGHLLDLLLRGRTENRKSLDDVMRLINERYGQTGRFFEDSDALEAAISEVAGADLSATYDELVRTASAIDWDHYLGHAGYRLLREEESRPHLGLTLANPAGQGVIVAEIEPSGPAEEAGLRRGDRILKVQGRRITGGSYEALRRLEKMTGRSAEVQVERRGLLHTLELRPLLQPTSAYRIAPAGELTPLQERVRNGWFARTVEAPSALPSAE